jgi:hypothetical protein
LLFGLAGEPLQVLLARIDFSRKLERRQGTEPQAQLGSDGATRAALVLEVLVGVPPRLTIATPLFSWNWMGKVGGSREKESLLAPKSSEASVLVWLVPFKPSAHPP